jgi:hypothetical protein
MTIREKLIDRSYGAERFFALMGMEFYARMMRDLRDELRK